MKNNTQTYTVQTKNTIPTIRIKCCVNPTQSGYKNFKVSHHLDIDKANTSRRQGHTCPFCGQERKLSWCNKECNVELVDKSNSIAKRIKVFNDLQSEYDIKIHKDCYSVEKTSPVTGMYWGTVHSSKDSEFILLFIEKITNKINAELGQ